MHDHLHRDPAGGYVSYTKGAVEVILERCRDVASASGTAEVDTHNLGTVSERMAGAGLRVLALGLRRWSALPDDVSPRPWSAT